MWIFGTVHCASNAFADIPVCNLDFSSQKVMHACNSVSLRWNLTAQHEEVLNFLRYAEIKTRDSYSPSNPYTALGGYNGCQPIQISGECETGCGYAFSLWNHRWRTLDLSACKCIVQFCVSIEPLGLLEEKRGMFWDDNHWQISQMKRTQLHMQSFLSYPFFFFLKRWCLSQKVGV